MPESLPLSLLNDFLYCPRRAALKVVEGWREANEHTVLGDIVHEHADLPGYEVAKGVKLLRALPVFSERLGLSGKCDIVEAHPIVAGVTRLTSPAPRPSAVNSQPPTAGKSAPTDVGGYATLVPVEYKKGKRRQFENDDAQLCAQALCLEEMFKLSVERGAVFHAESKRRREVEFTPALRQSTLAAIAELHALLNPQPITLNPQLPPAIYKPACEECSLFKICLPRVTSQPASLRRAAAQLFET
jgi:CRISPR-associated exonuclease Cas4